MSTKIRPELQIKPGSQSQVLTTVDGKATWADAQMPDISNITNLESQLETKADKVDTYTKEQVDQKVSDLVGSAPETLNTLQEIAQALNNDDNAYTSLSNSLRQYIDEKTAELVNQTGVDNLKDNTVATFNALTDLVQQELNDLASAGILVPTNIVHKVSSPISKGSTIEGITVEDKLSLYVDVYLNGVLQNRLDDYHVLRTPGASTATLTTLNALEVGDVITVQYRPSHFVHALAINNSRFDGFNPATTMNR